MAIGARVIAISRGGQSDQHGGKQAPGKRADGSLKPSLGTVGRIPS